jgi:hypothetical protein
MSGIEPHLFSTKPVTGVLSYRLTPAAPKCNGCDLVIFFWRLTTTTTIIIIILELSLTVLLQYSTEVKQASIPG